MDTIVKTLLQYLLKSGIVASAQNYLIPNVRQYIKTTMMQLIIQIVILAALLFIIDWVLPRFLPILYPLQGTGIDIEENIALDTEEDETLMQQMMN